MDYNGENYETEAPTVTAETKSPPGRIGYIDLCKSLGILLMIMGHIGYGDTFDHFIHAFHMPLFFLISGFLFRSGNLTLPCFLRKKAFTLLVPYLVFGLGQFLLYIPRQLIAGNPVSLQPLLHLLFINTTGLPNCGSLWFLTALFFTDLLFFLLDRYCPQPLLRGAFIAALALFGNVCGLTLPYALRPALVGLGLYYIGFLLRSYGSRLLNLNWSSTLLLGVFTVWLIFRNGDVNMRKSIYAYIPLFWVNAVMSSVVMLNLSRLLEGLLRDTRFSRWLLGMGRDSIVYVCLNQIVILGAAALLERTGLSGAPVKLLTLPLTLLFLYALSRLILDTKLKILAGRADNIRR